MINWFWHKDDPTGYVTPPDLRQRIEQGEAECEEIVLPGGGKVLLTRSLPVCPDCGERVRANPLSDSRRREYRCRDHWWRHGGDVQRPDPSRGWERCEAPGNDLWSAWQQLEGEFHCVGMVPARAAAARSKAVRPSAAADATRQRSGAVDDARPIVSLFYVLLRDGHLAPSDLENAMLEIESVAAGATALFSNGWLAQYAQDVAGRLEMGSR